MALSGTPAVFYLSLQGEQALAGWFGGRSSFSALMVDSDAVGAWILVTEIQNEGKAEPVMLLKWDYVATMTFETSLERLPARIPIGFHP